MQNHIIFQILLLGFFCSLSNTVLQSDGHYISLTPNLELQRIQEDNFKPIIAVLSIPHVKNKKSVISTDIVRFIEEGGARVIPIHYKTPWKTVKSILDQANGVVFQGGGPKHWPQNQIPDHFNMQWAIFKYAFEMNEQGNYFPVLGICLGFQRLMEFSALWYTNQKEFTAQSRDEVYSIRDKYFGISKVDSQYHASNLEILMNNSLMFNSSTETIQKFGMNDTKKLFFLNNQFGLNEMEVNNNEIFNKSWKIVARTQDFEGKWFVGAVEHVIYPFFGLQIHPEKIQFDSNDHLKQITAADHIRYIPCSAEAILVNARISINFVQECKKNKNSFRATEEYEPKLIDNYKTYIHRGGDISSYYGIEEGFQDFDEMTTALSEVQRKLKKK